MKFRERLYFLLGIRRQKENRMFELAEPLHAALVDLAEREQRPAQELQADLLANGLARRSAEGDKWKRWQSLSPRERDVSALACLGYTNRQMAARLGVAEETVKTHLKNALVKFELHGKGELRVTLGDWDFSAWKEP
jgi:DNA-binding CsgD family transcriptional regulator